MSEKPTFIVIFILCYLFSCENEGNYYSISAYSKDGAVNAVIEIPAGSNVKKEYDPSANTFYVDQENGKDRVINFLPYIGNYGFIPSTYSDPKKEGNSFLALRIQGAYPDRVDAVFNLDSGKLKNVKKAGRFENENAKIEPLGNGYYKCVLTGKINASNVSLLIGTTSKENKILSWEAKSEDSKSVKIIPSSLKLEIL
ncbi:inorganic diphosphatase [uncultured Winogradskyella sp.]|uniref:inorganic diphosphatase n=1 Tax=uncultured Winogradskyella sp. TaxID=395353 RepID=UPI00262A0D85|nr:inorganic diphosphatase [uncultured Winogradskyella sp.]